MLVEFLTKKGTRDLLVPHFSFRQLLYKAQEVELFEAIAKLRYEVYCTECKYLNESDYASGMETDAYEDRSVHVAAQTRDGALVGTVRLVLAPAGEEFPFEEHCAVFPDFKFPPREQCGEISRLIVKKNFRRRPGDTLEGVSKEFQEKGSAESITPHENGLSSKERRNASPQIMLGMYREIYRYSLEHGIRYWYAAMEKGLVRLLDRMGFHFVPVGPVTDYYGPVATYIADLRQVENALRNANKFLLAWFQGEPISDWLLITTLVKYKLGHLGKL